MRLSRRIVEVLSSLHSICVVSKNPNLGYCRRRSSFHTARIVIYYPELLTVVESARSTVNMGHIDPPVHLPHTDTTDIPSGITSQNTIHPQVPDHVALTVPNDPHMVPHAGHLLRVLPRRPLLSTRQRHEREQVRARSVLKSTLTDVRLWLTVRYVVSGRLPAST
jgi:hypothetical protein